MLAVYNALGLLPNATHELFNLPLKMPAILQVKKPRLNYVALSQTPNWLELPHFIPAALM
jgi:hypothetical protein